MSVPTDPGGPGGDAARAGGGPGVTPMLDEAALRARDRADVPWDWLAPCYDGFRGVVSDQGYPCYFGTNSLDHGGNRYSYLDRREERPSALRRIADALAAYIADPVREAHPRRSLIVFEGPPESASLAGYESRFWSLLADLGPLDPAPWPEEVPTDPLDPAWQWCFAGEPWFVFGGCPAYQRRRSRALGPALVWVFQTRDVFTGIGGETPAGRKAKRTVRQRLRAYDLVGHHPAMGDPEHSSVHKWRQYFLPDDDTLADPGACPLRRADERAGGET